VQSVGDGGGNIDGQNANSYQFDTQRKKPSSASRIIGGFLEVPNISSFNVTFSTRSVLAIPAPTMTRLHRSGSIDSIRPLYGDEDMMVQLNARGRMLLSSSEASDVYLKHQDV
jgi:hypothetical protein